MGRRIVEFEQGGKARAGYGEALLIRLAADLAKHGRGFSRPGLQRMRAFYLGWEICSTPLSEFAARVRLSGNGDARFSESSPARIFEGILITFSLSRSLTPRLTPLQVCVQWFIIVLSLDL